MKSSMGAFFKPTFVLAPALLCQLLSACASENSGSAQGSESDPSEAANSTASDLKYGVFATPYGPHEFPYREIDGLKITDGDIVLGEELSASQERAAVKNLASAKWPQNVVFYSIEADLVTDQNRTQSDPLYNQGPRVAQAISKWQAAAPIRFVENANAPSRIHFHRNPVGCNSSVGRTGSVQNVNIDDTCYQSGVVHELGHALGLFHEQQRTDRASWITFNSTCDWSYGPDWGLQPSTADVGPFDFSSIMMRDGCGTCSNGQYAMVHKASPSQCVAAPTVISAGDVAGVKWLHGNWKGTKIGAPGGGFAIKNNGTLYGLQPNGGGVWLYNGSGESWSSIGGSGTSRILAGGANLYRIATNGDVYKHSTSSTWTKIGSPGVDFAVDSNGVIYAISSDGAAVYKYSGSGTSWSNIGSGGARLYAGGSNLFKTVSNGDIYKYGGGTTWTKVGSPGKGLAVDRTGQLYAIQSDWNGVWKYSGTGQSWTQIGGGAASIHPADNTIFSVSPTNGEVWRYESGQSWSHVNGPATAVYAASSMVAATANGSGDVYRYSL